MGIEFSKFENHLDESLKFGFINNLKFRDSSYSPKVVVNNAETGETILTEIQEELQKSYSFSFNVAFVTQGGIAMLKTQLLDFAGKGKFGRILISPYLDFNDPDALRELLKLKNIDVRMINEKLNSHAKFYLFNSDAKQTVLAGSSNLTHSALKLNYEWNVKLTSSENGEFIRKTQQEFERIWDASKQLTEEVIADYEDSRKPLIDYRIEHIVKEENYKTVKPNRMQKDAMKSLKKMRDLGKDKALVISATGTGKTYMAAFDVKQFQAKKMLFLVHREQILRDAQESFQNVLKFNDDNSVIYRSGIDVSDKQYVFATVQTISKEKNLNQLDPALFDYIVIDEVHKAGAQTYQTVINYFTPKFLLGMTATPERTDDQNIYELFDYNIAYEIRLQDALDEEMLTPFFYYGVTEVKADGELLDEKVDFSDLITDKRVDHVLEKIDYYSMAGQKRRGLIFCSSNKESKELSEKLNKKSLKTTSLSGADSQEKREETIKKLEKGELEYILTVDIFNEGVDIPSINQIIMLRNTESSIIFVQQLGRGLRKHPTKEYVTVIDFIGNYKNNYLIPIALFGDQSMSKDTSRKNMANRNQISGVTTINFEEIAQKQIFSSISQTNLRTFTNFKKTYEGLKNRLGRMPLTIDYINEDSLDPDLMFGSKTKLNHYGEFIYRVEKDENYLFDEEVNGLLSFVSLELLNGKRPHELLLFDELVKQKGELSKEAYYKRLQKEEVLFDQRDIYSLERVISYEFFTSNQRKKYKNPGVIIEDNQYTATEVLNRTLRNPYGATLLFDALKSGLKRNKKYTSYHIYDPNRLTKGEIYTRKDACKLLGWENNEEGTLFGYRVKHGTCPIFVTYHKSEDISETTQYGDEFLNDQVFKWQTKSNTNLETKEVKKILHAKENNIDLHLFIKKRDSEGKDFYYFGEVEVEENSPKETVMETDGETPVVEMNLLLEQPVPYNLYHYLTTE